MNTIKFIQKRIENAFSFLLILSAILGGAILMGIINAIFKTTIMESWGYGILVMFIAFCFLDPDDPY